MDVLMPQLGETVTEGTIASWHKKVGDRVEADEILLEIETDKVSMEIPSPGTGVLAQILVDVGETVPVGTVLAVVEVAGEPKGTAATSSAPAAESSSAPTGAATGGNGAAAPGAAAASAARGPSSSGAAGAVRRQPGQRLSPAVRRLAAEHALELARIEGTGRNGRITRRDVIRYLQGAKAAVAEPRAAEARPETPGERKIVPFTRIRKLTAEHMVRSKATSAHVLQAVEVDFANVDLVRNQVRDAWRGRRGYSLTYLPFIASAVCEALGEFPNLNASVEGDSLVIHPHVNLAIAVDLGPEGLVAPVIRSAETLSVTELAEAIHEIANRARQGRLKPDDLAGGTYTISNNGSFGTLITAPIINQPQVAILSTDGVRKKPVVVEAPEGDSIAIRPVGILAQSFDHRAVDGAYSGAFLSRVKKILEQRRFGIQP
ncbi:MAG: 2-oxo acid dehydrogenase subunit E2 [Gammaproteobacteria bacterium]|nr:dihydrolipoyllysine-residue succinyltransferase [Gammaproteobacteria bacterium]